MEENKVKMFVESWLKKRGVKTVSYWEAKEFFGYNTRVKPDLLVKPKYSKKRLIAIEVKGSNFDMNELIGQLLIYSLNSPYVYVAVPAEHEKPLRKLRSKIRRRMKGFDFGIISVNEAGGVRAYID